MGLGLIKIDRMDTLISRLKVVIWVLEGCFFTAGRIRFQLCNIMHSSHLIYHYHNQGNDDSFHRNMFLLP